MITTIADLLPTAGSGTAKATNPVSKTASGETSFAKVLTAACAECQDTAENAETDVEETESAETCPAEMGDSEAADPADTTVAEILLCLAGNASPVETAPAGNDLVSGETVSSIESVEPAVAPLPQTVQETQVVGEPPVVPHVNPEGEVMEAAPAPGAQPRVMPEMGASHPAVHDPTAVEQLSENIVPEESMATATPSGGAAIQPASESVQTDRQTAALTAPQTTPSSEATPQRVSSEPDAGRAADSAPRAESQPEPTVSALAETDSPEMFLTGKDASDIALAKQPAAQPSTPRAETNARIAERAVRAATSQDTAAAKETNTAATAETTPANVSKSAAFHPFTATEAKPNALKAMESAPETVERTAHRATLAVPAKSGDSPLVHAATPAAGGVDTVPKVESLTASGSVQESPLPSETVTAPAIKNVRCLVSKGQQSVTVRLVPASLGELHVEVQHNGGELAVRLVSANPAVRDTLESQAPLLKAALSREGLSVNHLEVAANMGQTAHPGGQPGQTAHQEASTRPLWNADRSYQNDAAVSTAVATPRFAAHYGALDVFA